MAFASVPSPASVVADAVSVLVPTLLIAEPRTILPVTAMLLPVIVSSKSMITPAFTPVAPAVVPVTPLIDDTCASLFWLLTTAPSLVSVVAASVMLLVALLLVAKASCMLPVDVTDDDVVAPTISVRSGIGSLSSALIVPLPPSWRLTTAKAASAVRAVEPGVPVALAAVVNVVADAARALVAEAPSAKAWIRLLDVDTDELVSAAPTRVNMADEAEPVSTRAKTSASFDNSWMLAMTEAFAIAPATVVPCDKVPPTDKVVVFAATAPCACAVIALRSLLIELPFVTPPVALTLKPAMVVACTSPLVTWSDSVEKAPFTVPASPVMVEAGVASGAFRVRVVAAIFCVLVATLPFAELRTRLSVNAMPLELTAAVAMTTPASAPVTPMVEVTGASLSWVLRRAPLLFRVVADSARLFAALLLEARASCTLPVESTDDAVTVSVIAVRTVSESCNLAFTAPVPLSWLLTTAKAAFAVWPVDPGVAAEPAGVVSVVADAVSALVAEAPSAEACTRLSEVDTDELDSTPVMLVKTACVVVVSTVADTAAPFANS